MCVDDDILLLLKVRVTGLAVGQFVLKVGGLGLRFGGCGLGIRKFGSHFLHLALLLPGAQAQQPQQQSHR